MALYLKDREVDHLARELAHLQNTSITEAVRSALQDRRARLLRDREAKIRKIEETLDEIAKLPVYDDRSPDEMLYDEHGCPK
jgi:antitoxin VapB